MKLPTQRGVRIPQAKIEDYLLSVAHPVGAAKARFFLACGFDHAAPEQFAAALKAHPERNAVRRIVETPYGAKYIVECSIGTPDRRDPCVRSVWLLDPDGIPRLITAHPL